MLYFSYTSLSPLLEREFSLELSSSLTNQKSFREGRVCFESWRDRRFCSPASVSSDRLQTLAFSPSLPAMDGWLLSLSCGGFLSSASLAYDSASRSFGVDGGSSPGLSRVR